MNNLANNEEDKFETIFTSISRAEALLSERSPLALAELNNIIQNVAKIKEEFSELQREYDAMILKNQ